MYTWKQFRQVVVDAVDASGFVRVGRQLKWYVVAGELTWVFIMKRDRREISFDFSLWVAPSEWFSEGCENALQALSIRPVMLVAPSEFDLVINYYGDDLSFWERLLDATPGKYTFIENKHGNIAQDTLANREYDLRLLFSALYIETTKIRSKRDVDLLFHEPDSGKTVNWDYIFNRMVDSDSSPSYI